MDPLPEESLKLEILQVFLEQVMMQQLNLF